MGLPFDRLDDLRLRAQRLQDLVEGQDETLLPDVFGLAPADARDLPRPRPGLRGRAPGGLLRAPRAPVRADAGDAGPRGEGRAHGTGTREGSPGDGREGPGAGDRPRAPLARPDEGTPGAAA